MPASSHPPVLSYVQRGRFVSVEDGFNIKRVALEACVFETECALAFHPESPTGRIFLDRGDVLGTAWPATTPLMLASYLRICAGDQLRTRFICGGAIHVVLQGSGTWQAGGDSFDWKEGDVFVLPGGIESSYRAIADSIVYCVTNEPLFAFERADIMPTSQVAPVLYPAAHVAEQMRELACKVMTPETPGRAVNLSSDSLANERTALSSLTATFNLVLPGEWQRPHRHCAAALALILRASGCHSIIGRKRLDWQPNTVVLTPALEPHTHCNEGSEPALAFIVQDGGLHYYAGTMDFSFAD
jgi:gentisate 1,2-dioxygenase